MCVKMNLRTRSNRALFKESSSLFSGEGCRELGGTKVEALRSFPIMPCGPLRSSQTLQTRGRPRLKTHILPLGIPKFEF